jgi:hypothetical protein
MLSGCTFGAMIQSSDLTRSRTDGPDKVAWFGDPDDHILSLTQEDA